MAMKTDALNDFPSEQFHAFSMTKMAKFLPYTGDTTIAQLKDFFGEDFNRAVQFRADQLIIYDRRNAIPVETNKIIVRFANGHYKVIDSDYYHRNFNEPLV
ncbi:hypothetical protein ACFQ5M_08855 [Agrilactobacillus yilanensis]|uniref:Uncharacterized protein n=1 Tax=Agrilactobacillus yilanensis TaxID=2485997 RepID=A0ABW4JAG7_9LACO|nr:hypothetical protein [Agrilactobacillus yilanensis]